MKRTHHWAAVGVAALLTMSQALTLRPAHAAKDPAAPAAAAAEFAGVAQFIVRFDPAVTTIAAVNAAGGTTTAAVSGGAVGTDLLNVPTGTDPVAAATAILALPGVDWLTPNAPIAPPEVDLSRIYAWRIYAWSIGTPIPAESSYAASAVHTAEAQLLSTGDGVTVAVLDTGIQMTPHIHPAFAGMLVPGADLIDGDLVPAETANGRDDDADGLIDEGIGHGTHVAGIVHQVAPQARIMPVRVLDDDGSGTLWSVSEGMYWASDHGAQVLSLSLGTHGSAEVLREAVQVVSDRGVLVVAAAGNDGRDRKMYPAAAPAALAVGSVGAGDIVSSFSNFGRWIDVMAPGENIHSTYAYPADSYAMNSGTSMATPWVAGEAALILARRPGLNPAETAGAITAGATPIDALNPTRTGLIGAGRIDLAASVRSG
jgi:subtilisin family serine protease